jgi:hypothetical protein
MKAVILALTIAGAAATAPLNAQILGPRVPTSTGRTTSVNGSWQVVGQDRNGNTIYERRTYDANGNIIVQRARRDVNGNFSILSTRTVRNDNNRDCQLASTNGTVGDIILGRSGTTDCRNDRRSVDGVWRQVGQGRNNNSVYERRTLDAYGNVVVQKARRNSDGTFTILSTRTARGNQGRGSRGIGNRGDDDEDNARYDRRHDDDDDHYDRRHDDDDHDEDNARYGRRHGDDDDHRFNSSERNGRGRGRGHKGRD